MDDEDYDPSKSQEQLIADRKLFSEIRDEIIFAIQSINKPIIRDHFMKSVKFVGDQVLFNDSWAGPENQWKLYSMQENL